MIETTLPSFGLAVCALLVTGVLVVLLWERRDRPTAWSLLGFATVLCVLVVSHVAVIHLGPTRSVVASVGDEFAATAVGTTIASLGYLAAFGLWAVFAFDYTGRGSSATTAVRALAGGIGVATVSLFAISSTALVSTAVANVFYNTALIAVIVLAVVGVFLIVDESTRLGPLPRREALAMAAAVGVLVPSPLLYFPTNDSLGLTGPVLASGLLLVVTLRWGTPLTTLPATSVVGRDRVVADMSDGVLVVDQDGTVQDANPAGVRLLGADRDAVVGTEWSSLFPDAPGPERVAQSTRPVELERAETAVAVTASAVRDRQDRPLGHLVVCQDVTARRERERRLAVLSRFLVDTASEGMDDVTRSADRLADGVTDLERRRQLGSDIWTTATDLVTQVEYAREIERALADPESQDSDVAAVVRRVTADAAADAMPSVETDDAAHAAVTPSLLEPVLRLLVVEVVEAPVQALTCAVRTDEDADEVTVTIDGSPGDTGDDRTAHPRETATDDTGGPATTDGATNLDTADSSPGPVSDPSTDGRAGRDGVQHADRSGVAARLARLGVESVDGTVTVRRKTTPEESGDTPPPVASVTVRVPLAGDETTRAATEPDTTDVDGAAPVAGSESGGES